MAVGLAGAGVLKVAIGIPVDQELSQFVNLVFAGRCVVKFHTDILSSVFEKDPHFIATFVCSKLNIFNGTDFGVTFVISFSTEKMIENVNGVLRFVEVDFD